MRCAVQARYAISVYRAGQICCMHNVQQQEKTDKKEEKEKKGGEIMAVRGKQRWTPVDALKQQFDDGRDYISCPECKYFLADIKPNFHVVQEFSCQFSDGRVHLTCPKCHALLGKKFWDRPTIGDRIRYACEFQISDMSWRARWITSLVISVGLVVGLSIMMALDSGHSWATWLNYVINNFGDFLKGLIALLGLTVMLFGFIWVFLSPGGGNYNYAWLWWFNNNRR
ncbi:MAG TPA: hypothetical protein PLG04_02975 [Anaerolineaceae bacterium]|nr:hypothetical protein [Anaerolineaceae bacterium]